MLQGLLGEVRAPQPRVQHHVEELAAGQEYPFATWHLGGGRAGEGGGDRFWPVTG